MRIRSLKNLRLSVLVLLIGFGSFSALAEGKKNSLRFPYVTELKGPAELVDKNGNSVPAKKLASMMERVTYVVPAGSELEIQIAPMTILQIFSNSRVELPVLAWEDGNAERIFIHSGRIRYRCESACERKIETPLSQDLVKEGDFEYSYEGQIPKVEVKVHQGQISFRGLENEISVALSAAQSAAFIGELEGGKPTYDVLLKGRKVARGKLTQMQSFTPEPLKPLLGAKEKREQIRKQAELAEKAASKGLCKKPNANLNQCAWICEKNGKRAPSCAAGSGVECARYRCNANGEWADRQVLAKGLGRCTTKPLVAECDY